VPTIFGASRFIRSASSQRHDKGVAIAIHVDGTYQTLFRSSMIIV
jgi:hypothetical protein